MHSKAEQPAAKPALVQDGKQGRRQLSRAGVAGELLAEPQPEPAEGAAAVTREEKASIQPSRVSRFSPSRLPSAQNTSTANPDQSPPPNIPAMSAIEPTTTPTSPSQYSSVMILGVTIASKNKVCFMKVPFRCAGQRAHGAEHRPVPGG